MEDLGTESALRRDANFPYDGTVGEGIAMA